MQIVNLKNKKSMGPDNINSFLLKLALPYVVESLTHVYISYIKTINNNTTYALNKIAFLPF